MVNLAAYIKWADNYFYLVEVSKKSLYMAKGKRTKNFSVVLTFVFKLIKFSRLYHYENFLDLTFLQTIDIYLHGIHKMLLCYLFRINGFLKKINYCSRSEKIFQVQNSVTCSSLFYVYFEMKTCVQNYYWHFVIIR